MRKNAFYEENRLYFDLDCRTFFFYLPGSFDPRKRTLMQLANTFECTSMATKYKATREDVFNVYRKYVICKLDMILYDVFIVCLQCLAYIYIQAYSIVSLIE